MEEIRLDRIRYNNKIFLFREPIHVTIDREEDWCSIDSEDLDLHAGGKTEEDSLEDFSEEVCLAWDFYTNQDVQKMTYGALQLRNYLIENVIVESAG